MEHIRHGIKRIGTSILLLLLTLLMLPAESAQAATKIKGIDVSRWQGKVDWKKVKASGVEFVMLGIGRYHNGVRVPDTEFTYNITNALANGIHVGVYLYSEAGDVKTAKKEAQFMLDMIDGYKISYPVAFDIGSFNGRGFSYVAFFGAFTKASNATPQNVKNALGHLAYILEGINTISSIRAEHMVIEADGMSYEDDYIFGAISNSTSIAGILTLKPELVDMSDGLFEMLLIKAPRDLIELAEIVHMLTTQNYESDMLTFVNASEFLIHASAETSWTLDGEYQEGCEEIKVENLHHAINLMMR